MANELELYKSGEMLPALANDPRNVIEAIAANLGGAQINEANLTKIKVPSGGALFFSVPSLEGETPEKALIGTIVHHKNGRAYFSKSFDDTAADERFPDCYSEDGTTGTGSPGGDCATCPLNQFGSAIRKGEPTKGKACGERKTLYMIRGAQMMPDIVSLPTTSIRPCNDFMFKLAVSGIKYFSALISITLERTKSSGDIEYSEARFAFVRKLNPQEAENAGMWSALMAALSNDSMAARKALPPRQ